MVEREEVVRVAREKLGAMSRMATGEYTMLANLLEPEETVHAMVVAGTGRWRSLAPGWVIAATDRRLLLVSKAMLTRRERIEEIALSRVRGARSDPPVRLVLEVDDEERVFSFAGPPPQVAALVAVARGEGNGGRFAELAALARRKLGRMLAFSLEAELVVLADALGGDEAVLDLAYSADTPSSLVAVCPDRVVLVGPQSLRKRTPATSIDYADVVSVVDNGDELLLETRTGEARVGLRKVVPADAAPIIAVRIRARTSGR